MHGRKSGKAYSLPVMYLQEGTLVSCWTLALGANNLRGGAPVTGIIKDAPCMALRPFSLTNREEVQ
jgi:hypothetical protein